MPELIEQNIINTLIEKATDLAQDFARGESPISPQYKASVYHREELSVHFRWKSSPGSLIQNVRPNEPDMVQNYRALNYEQNTFPVGFSVINALKGVLSNPQVFEIKFPDNDVDTIDKEANEGFEDYLTKGAAVPGKNLIKYFWDFLAIQELLDSNGYIVMINQKSDREIEEIKQSGNPSDLVQWRTPAAFFIPSTHVMKEGRDFVFVKSTEFQVIKIKDNVYHVPIFWYFTDDITFRIEAIGGREEKKDNKTEVIFDWDTIVWDAHFSGMAAYKPKGIVSDERVWEENGQIKRHISVMEMDDVGFFLSILSLAVPDFNRAVKILSDLESGLVASLYPIRTVEMQMCETCKGTGDIRDPFNDEAEPRTCGTCKGVGKTFPTGPFAAVAKNPNEAGVINPAVVWSSPPTTSFDFAWKMYIEAILSGLKALAHGQLREATGNVRETARAKEIDMSQQHIIAREVGSIWYPTLQWILDKANQLRYGSLLDESELKMNRASVIQPATLDITMLSDLFDQLEKMQTISMPAPIRRIWASRAISRDMGNDSPSAKLAQVYLSIDPYALMKEEEIMVMNARDMDGNSTETAINQYIHDNLHSLVNELITQFAEMRPAIDYLSLNTKLQIQEARKLALSKLNISEDALL